MRRALPPFPSRRPTQGWPADITALCARRVKQASWAPPPDNPHHAEAAGGRIEVAVKVIRKKALKGDLQAVFDEVEVLTGLNHPNVGALFCKAGHRLEAAARPRWHRSGSGSVADLHDLLRLHSQALRHV